MRIGGRGDGVGGGGSFPRLFLLAVDSGIMYITDDFKFSALPGGKREVSGGRSSSSARFVEIGDYGYWWTATEISDNNAHYRSMWYSSNNVYSEDGGDKMYGRSVRCIQD
jgi:uncharacterized protein (TIGR02145 family)